MAEPILRVLLHQRPIGTLTLLAGDQTVFAFDESYIKDKLRPTLSLSFKAPMGELITDIKPTRARVPHFFANLLPEGPLRAYLAKRAGVKDSREFFLLRVLGRDLPGAVKIQESEGGVASAKEGKNEEAMNRRKGALHFSLAGVQLKFSAVREAAGGLTIPTEGSGGSWIVKLPSTSFEAVPENEFAMMGLAAEVGIDVPENTLIPIGDISGLPDDIRGMKGDAFAIKRFDRTETGAAVHIEDFAQVFGVYPEKKYEKANYRNLAQVILAESGQEDIAEFIRRLVFNTLIGNADMHLKNWSLIYPNRRQAALAPAYDFVSTIPYINDASTALKMGKSKKMAELSRDMLSRFAAKARLAEKPVLETAENTVGRLMTAWKNGEYLDDLPFIRDAIQAHLKTIRLVTEIGRESS
ncbi:MAG: type II toxin-antitoxin system HipA family toxin [Desulfobacteraceae bacterium]|nr:MAG: type II toxin-antitoxin system HipA family toxin [Desulfobacteraceae bacterium]